MLDCGDEFSEVTAAAAILTIDPSRAEDVLPVLVDALESWDYGIRCNATWRIGELGAIVKEAVPALRRLLVDLSIPGDETIRSLVVGAIESITGEDPLL